MVRRRRRKLGALGGPFDAPRPFQPAAGSVPAAGPAVQTQSVQHGEVIPVGTYTIRGCCTKPKGAKTCNGPPRPGQVDLVFPSRQDAKKFKVPVGPALQFCTALRQGVFVPVKDPRTAKRIAHAYTDCVEKGATVSACVTKFSKGALGGLRRRRRRLRRRRGR